MYEFSMHEIELKFEVWNNLAHILKNRLPNFRWIHYQPSGKIAVALIFDTNEELIEFKMRYL
jgi:inorganic triphosphatase YgiF